MEWIEPMEPTLRPDVPFGAEWIHQIKWDGVRGLCQVEDGAIRIFMKSGRERTDFYPELMEVPALLRARSAYLDGEIVVFDDTGRPSFGLAQARERIADPSRVSLYARKKPARYIVFDIIMLDGKDLTSHPLRQRYALLKERLSPGNNTVITDDFSDGDALLDLMREKNMEGIVSKRASSLYKGGKNHRDWFKIKLSKKLLAAVCGLSMKDGFPNSLILGINRDGKWLCIGKASLGLTQEHMRLLKERMPLFELPDSPFHPAPPGMKNAVWLNPVLTCWVSFLERANDGGLRHPKIVGFSSSSPDEADGTELPIKH